MSPSAGPDPALVTALVAFIVLLIIVGVSIWAVQIRFRRRGINIQGNVAMSVQVDCACGKTVWVPDSESGKSIACPFCARKMPVPAMTPEMLYGKIPVDASAVFGALLRGMAITSLAFGIVSMLSWLVVLTSWTGVGFQLTGLAPGFIAIAFGAVALGAIRKAPHLTGDGLALAGLLLGAGGLGGYALIILVNMQHWGRIW